MNNKRKHFTAPSSGSLVPLGGVVAFTKLLFKVSAFATKIKV
jgi:hypothetical protein